MRSSPSRIGYAGNGRSPTWIGSFQRRQREFREDLNQRRNEELSAVLDKANRAIKEIAEREKFDLILQEAVFVSPAHGHHGAGRQAAERRQIASLAASVPQSTDPEAPAAGLACGER